MYEAQVNLIQVGLTVALPTCVRYAPAVGLCPVPANSLQSLKSDRLCDKIWKSKVNKGKEKLKKILVVSSR